MYSQLNPDNLIKTAKKLQDRISERFKGRGIVEVATELVIVTEKAKLEAVRLHRPHWALRILVTAAVIAGAFLFVYVGTFLNLTKVGDDTLGIVQSLEAGINTLILAGVGIVFLFNVERRRKRKQALKALHELRSLTHVIDMHQLTKDPAIIVSGPATESSPERTLDAFMLTRYLDYCSEMLALCGKSAALYAQYFDDPVIISASNDIEELSTNLSRKIWQKIILIHGTDAHGKESSKDEIKAALMSVAGR